MRRSSRTWACRPEHRRVRPPVGRNCKRPEIPQSTHFRRPGANGRGDRLRHSFSEPRFGARSQGKPRSRFPRIKLISAAIDPRQAVVEPKDCVSGLSSALPGGPWGEKKAFEFPILFFLGGPAAVHSYSGLLGTACFAGGGQRTLKRAVGLAQQAVEPGNATVGLSVAFTQRCTPARR